MKFERNLCIRFRDNCVTDDGRRRNFDFMSSADIVKQSKKYGPVVAVAGESLDPSVKKY